MEGIRNLLDRVLTFICVVLFIEMTIVGTYQIVTRYFFNSPSTVSEEIVTYSFTWLAILAAALVFGKRGHLCMTFFVSRFTGRKRVCLDLFSEIMVLVMAVPLLLYGGYIMADQNVTQETASLGISMGLMYAVLPVAGVIICIYCFLNISELLGKLNAPDVDSYGVQPTA